MSDPFSRFGNFFETSGTRVDAETRRIDRHEHVCGDSKVGEEENDSVFTVASLSAHSSFRHNWIIYGPRRKTKQSRYSIFC